VRGEQIGWSASSGRNATVHPHGGVHPRVCGEQSTGGGHPRVRGEQQRGLAWCWGRSGSSPRARGTAATSSLRTMPPGFIPACAGNSWTASDSKPSQGFIPACAGNSRAFAPPGRPDRVHPRVRGEQQFFVSTQVSEAGGVVHPRVRGEQSHGRLLANVCNGSSPRARGTASPPSGRSTQGSSPRVRGTAMATSWPWSWTRFIPACAGNRGLQGFIPACAGNSLNSFITRLPTRVHPRVCGEQTISAGLPVFCTGSSPRVRGTVFVHAHHEFSNGFIPACAGNSPTSVLEQVRFIPACAGNSRASRSCVPVVHPRVCGEQLGE
jgi:hypothetical protein